MSSCKFARVQNFTAALDEEGSPDEDVALGCKLQAPDRAAWQECCRERVLTVNACCGDLIPFMHRRNYHGTPGTGWEHHAV